MSLRVLLRGIIKLKKDRWEQTAGLFFIANLPGKPACGRGAHGHAVKPGWGELKTLQKGLTILCIEF